MMNWLSFFVQTVTFFLFIWFCLKFVKPPVAAAMADRKARIADGLAAAEKAMMAQKEAEAAAAVQLKEAQSQAQDIVSTAERRAKEIESDADAKAGSEGERIIAQSQAEIEVEVNRAREALRREISEEALAGTHKLLKDGVDVNAHTNVLEELIEQI